MFQVFGGVFPGILCILSQIPNKKTHEIEKHLYGKGNDLRPYNKASPLFSSNSDRQQGLSGVNVRSSMSFLVPVGTLFKGNVILSLQSKVAGGHEVPT